MTRIQRRQLGNSDLMVSPVALGCWPIAGISSLGVSDSASLATIDAAFEAGINFFDTAYSYGYDGESDRLLRQALQSRYDQVIIASKVGSHYDANRNRILDARPATLHAQLDTIRRRLDLDRIDLLYLHTPDETTPIERSAEALADLAEANYVRYVGLSNATLEQSRRFASVIEPIAIQPPFNMLQPETLESLKPLIDEIHCGVACYWPLMKGLLAGELQRDHVFEPNDKRKTYPIFQGSAWQRAQDLVDVLRAIANETGYSVPAIVVAWTMHQPNITSVLCGAKRPEQIQQSAEAMTLQLDQDCLTLIENSIRAARA